jgi:polygalacturonase
VFGTAIAPAMENITYSNCTVHGALAGIRIKFRPTQFGFVRNILFEDIATYYVLLDSSSASFASFSPPPSPAMLWLPMKPSAACNAV